MQSGGDRPRIRPVEVHPSRRHPGAYDVHDPSGIASSVFTVSRATLAILALMNGELDRGDIQARCMVQRGRMLYTDELETLITQLDEGLFLDSPRFREHLQSLHDAYRAEAVRPLRDADSLGAPADQLGAYLDEILESHGAASVPVPAATLVGLVAPHLDYERGAPCYAAAYAGLAERCDARRFVILGTNHFGRARCVVGTRKDFETPWGVVPHDGDLMRRLDERCGVDLCEEEYDHAAEHSIELQVVLLRHVLGERPFTIVPYLCPDPCGPTGTAPADGRGVDLAAFADALREEIAADGVATCIIASADLSHVGRYFQDDRDLDESSLAEVGRLDLEALGFVTRGEYGAFRDVVASRENETNICSVGCIYAMSRATNGRGATTLLKYHQALTRELENCVTSAAMEVVSR